MDIIIDEAKHEVLIKQRWKLIDFTSMSTNHLVQRLGIDNIFFMLARWEEEFQRKTKKIIEEHWNQPDFFLLKLVLAGDETDFYRKNRVTIWSVRFQVDWVITDAH